MPERIQLRRTAGWRKPAGAVSVARPSRWGNPATIGAAIEHGFADTEVEARAVVVGRFRNWLLLGDDPGDQDVYWVGQRAYDRRWMRDHLHELAGRDLACWCPLVDDDGRPVPCHADVLLELANGEAAAP